MPLFSFPFPVTHDDGYKLERVELEVIWEKRDEKKNLNSVCVKTVETDRQHTNTHTHGWVLL